MAAQQTQKASADVEPLSGEFETLGNQKVQLDIDDAPFLDEPEEEQPAPPPATKESAVAQTKEEEKPKSGKKKLILIGLAAFVLLAVIGIVLKFVLFGDPSPPEPTAPVIIVRDPEPAAATSGPQFQTLDLDKFIVELKDSEGKRYFLNASFSLYTTNPTAVMEAQDKLIVLRDAIYYYLSTQDYEFLRNPDNNDEVQANLLDAVNENLVQGKIDRILFAQYLIR